MKNFAIGVDLGGTNLRIGAFSDTFECLAQRSAATRVSAGPEAVALDISNGVKDLLRECSGAGALRGVGIGSPGPLELPQGTFRLPPNFPGFDGFELKKTVEDLLGLPVIVESDANAAALAECLRGAGRRYGESSLCMLTLGTGVGGGIVLEGKIWHGINGMAAELGHIPIFPDGPRCPCGGRGCLELYASATGIRRAAAGMTGAAGRSSIASLGEVDPAQGAKELSRLAHAGDAQAKEIYRHVGRTLGISLAGLVNALNLPLYAIGGGVAAAWDLFQPAMIEALAEYSYVYRLTRPSDRDPEAKGSTRIVPAVLGAEAGLLGAAILPYE